MSIQIRFDMWAPSGKWKYGGVVEISGNFHIWDPEFLVEVVHNQNVVTPATFREYVVTTRDLDISEADVTYTHFYHQMYPIGAFTAAVNQCTRAAASGAHPLQQ